MKKIILLTLATLFTATTSIAQQASLWDRVPEEIKETKQFKRFEWFYKQRAYPYDTIPRYQYIAERNKEISKIKNLKKVNQSGLSWSSIGPYGVNNMSWLSHWGVSSGRVTAMAIHPTDPLTVYIGAAAGGIWKTINGGEDWEDIGTDMESLTFGAIAIDPNNPATIYAGTGQILHYTWVYCYEGNGMFKSINGGQTWDSIATDLGTPTHFGDLVVSPHNSDVLFAALGSGYFFNDANLPNEGIWKSSNGGVNWTRTLNVQDAFDIVVHPIDPNIVYAAVGGMYTTSGFYISTDMGNTWNQSNGGLPADSTIGRIQIDIAKSSPDIIYAIINSGPLSLDPGSYTTAYKSSNGGQNWSQISQGVHLGGKFGGYNYDFGFYCFCLAVNPSNSNQVIIANIELHETLNGTNFSPKRIPGGSDAWDCVVHVDNHKIVFAPSDPNYIYVGSDGGIHKSTDGGQTFDAINNGISTLQFYRIASHPNNPDTLIGGAQDNGNFRTFNKSSSEPWVVVSTGDGMECFFDYENPNIAFMSYWSGGIQRSTNGSITFNDLRTFSNAAWTFPFFMHPTDHNTLYVATNVIWRSINGGNTWNIISTGLTLSDRINAMAQSSVNPDKMILASGTDDFNPSFFSPLVMVSTDGGVSWTDITANIPGEPRYITRVVTHPTDENTMYIVRSGFSPSNKIYKTTDLGNTWDNISGDLPDLPCNDLFIDPDNVEQEGEHHLYVANDLGVYRSTSRGENWFYEGNGMPFVPAMDFDYVRIDTIGYLRVATHGRSAFETTRMVTSVEEEIVSQNIPVSFGLFQNYPNPFNNSTVIKYSIPQEGLVTLKIYNIIGEEIAMLVNDTKQTSHYEVSFDATGLPSGIYFYRLRAGSFIETKKMILMK